MSVTRSTGRGSLAERAEIAEGFSPRPPRLRETFSPVRPALAAACSVLLLAVAATADESFPKPGWRDYVNPLASPAAVAGGEISAFAGQYPESFNYYLDNNTFSARGLRHACTRRCST